MGYERFAVAVHVDLHVSLALVGHDMYAKGSCGSRQWLCLTAWHACGAKILSGTLGKQVSGKGGLGVRQEELYRRPQGEVGTAMPAMDHGKGL